MTTTEIKNLQKAAVAFRNSPCPTRADELLTLMAPHRRNPHIQQLIDEVLDYKYLVGTIPSPSGVAAG